MIQRAVDGELEQSEKLTIRLVQVSAQYPPQVVGASLAVLLSAWLMGHPPERRVAVLDFHISHVKELMAATTDPWANH